MAKHISTPTALAEASHLELDRNPFRLPPSFLDFRRAAVETAHQVAKHQGIVSILAYERHEAPSTLQELNDRMPIILDTDLEDPHRKSGVCMRRPTPKSPPTYVEGYRVPIADTTFGDVWTIWGQEGNHLFRANHELIHYQLQEEFNTTGEWHVCKRELSLYSRFAPTQWRDKIRLLIEAETWGQTGFHEITGGFPLDQVKFFECYERYGNPKDATNDYMNRRGGGISQE